MAVAEAWHPVPGRRVRSLAAGAPRTGVPELVLVPGLGALGYLLPLVRSAAGRTRVHLLDVPGFGHRTTAACPAALADVAAATAAWLADALPAPVLLAGHSTGAQAALRAALAVPDRVAGLALLGPTFPPELRRWGPLAAAAGRTASHERLGEVPATLPDYLRGRRRVLELLRTAMADAPEARVAGVGCPVLVARGARDRVSPGAWAQRLAGGAREGRAVTLPGAHNTPWTHPDATAGALGPLLSPRP